MKWALVVYFMTASGWQSAEILGKDNIGWSSILYATYHNVLLESECLILIEIACLRKILNMEIA